MLHGGSLQLATGAFPLFGPDGSNSAPSYANSTGKTGIYFSGENIQIAANQTRVFTGNTTAGQWLTTRFQIGSGSAAAAAFLGVNSVTDASISVCGNQTTASGAYFTAYGSTHATKANLVEIKTLNATNGAQAGTLLNLPTGPAAGNPAVWVEMYINGTLTYFPGWQ